MPLSISTNIASMAAQRSFINSNAALETSFERLSSGKRINSAVDDAAGLAIGKDLQSRVSGLNQAIRNTNDAISMVQIAEGAMDEATNILHRMRDLAVQAASDSLATTERGYLDTEHSKLATALDSALSQAKFNGTSLLTTSDVSKSFQIGADAGDALGVTFEKLSDGILNVHADDIVLNAAKKERVVFDQMALGTDTGTWEVTITPGSGSNVVLTSASATYTTMSQLATALNLDSDVSGFAFSAVDDELVLEYTATGDQSNTTYAITTTTNGTADAGATEYTGTSSAAASASAAISVIDTALDTLASDRATLGATQSQLESTVRNLANVAENTAAAAGRIMDTDYAAETANLTKAQILQQAATSILAQANAQPQAVLSLLQ